MSEAAARTFAAFKEAGVTNYAVAKRHVFHTIVAVAAADEETVKHHCTEAGIDSRIVHKLCYPGEPNPDPLAYPCGLVDAVARVKQVMPAAYTTPGSFSGSAVNLIRAVREGDADHIRKLCKEFGVELPLPLAKKEKTYG